ncbi:MAG: hypothetical protein LBG17_04760 [Bacteroidales bacterium]|jgi:hypothetical protein|nr:hypothetical protein [Bacteroidales bacterium]
MKQTIIYYITNIAFVIAGITTRLLSYWQKGKLDKKKAATELFSGVGLFVVAMIICEYFSLNSIWSCGVSYVLGYAGKSVFDLIINLGKEILRRKAEIK